MRQTNECPVTLRELATKLVCSVIAVASVLAACFGALYAYIVVLAVGDAWALPFVFFALLATYRGLPVMVESINQRLRAALSKVLKI